MNIALIAKIVGAETRAWVITHLILSDPYMGRSDLIIAYSKAFGQTHFHKLEDFNFAIEKWSNSQEFEALNCNPKEALERIGYKLIRSSAEL